jgi:catechol 2,3-dioxygenase-like lactoylglutathione lyase family enzyme
MDIERVDHFSIRTDDLERSRRFYTEVIGLKVGPRPPFDFPGYWLYAGDRPIVHLIGGTPPTRSNTGAFDHVAFAGNDKAALIERCRQASVAYRERTVPASNLAQVFVQDPDGLSLEINYRS